MSHATHADGAFDATRSTSAGAADRRSGLVDPPAAECYDVSGPTAKKWADRYRCEGLAGMRDGRHGSSGPHRQPNRTPTPVARKIVHLRWKRRLGPIEIGDRLAMPASTVHVALVRCRLNRLTHLDRATGEPIRRYGHEHPARSCSTWT